MQELILRSHRESSAEERKLILPPLQIYVGPFNITPANATSPADHSMLAADRGMKDALNCGADPESGAISPSGVGRLRIPGGCVPQS
jgi:hypothetical protein